MGHRMPATGHARNRGDGSRALRDRTANRRTALGFLRITRGPRLARQFLMPLSTPKATILLQAAVKYLEEELMPTLTGYHRFKTRVTANVLNTVRRELELRGAQAAAERKRLGALLGHDGEVEELSRELAQKIRDGAVALDDPELRSHISESLHDALAINNPKWFDR